MQTDAYPEKWLHAKLAWPAAFRIAGGFWAGRDPAAVSTGAAPANTLVSTAEFHASSQLHPLRPWHRQECAVEGGQDHAPSHTPPQACSFAFTRRAARVRSQWVGSPSRNPSGTSQACEIPSKPFTAFFLLPHFSAASLASCHCSCYFLPLYHCFRCAKDSRALEYAVQFCYSSPARASSLSKAPSDKPAVRLSASFPHLSQKAYLCAWNGRRWCTSPVHEYVGDCESRFQVAMGWS